MVLERDRGARCSMVQAMELHSSCIVRSIEKLQLVEVSYLINVMAYK